MGRGFEEVSLSLPLSESLCLFCKGEGFIPVSHMLEQVHVDICTIYSLKYFALSTCGACFLTAVGRFAILIKKIS